MARPQKNARSISEETRFYLLQACRQEAERLGGNDSTIDYFFQRAISSRVDQDKKGAIKVADMPLTEWCSAILWRTPGLPAKSSTPGILNKIQALTKTKPASTDQLAANDEHAPQLFRTPPSTRVTPTPTKTNANANAGDPAPTEQVKPQPLRKTRGSLSSSLRRRRRRRR